jgi:hypothetical protein
MRRVLAEQVRTIGLVSPADRSDRTRRVTAPPFLVVAVALVGAEAVALGLLGVVELGVLSSSRAVMGLTTALFFLAYGGGLGACAWQLLRLRSWARAPVVLAQLIQLPVAWGFRGGATTLVAALLAVAAVLVLVGVFHPSSIAAIDEADGSSDGSTDDSADDWTDRTDETSR